MHLRCPYSPLQVPDYINVYANLARTEDQPLDSRQEHLSPSNPFPPLEKTSVQTQTDPLQMLPLHSAPVDPSGIIEELHVSSAVCESN